MPTHKKLHIKFHGRIIDHLGIQMYQSPTAALAELIANSWDADAEKVDVVLPATLVGDACIVVTDDGKGMTFEDCEDRYLNVGHGRRGSKTVETSVKGRPILGRKGIGKFAGFGIAQIIRVETISEETGEKTVFEMDIDLLRGEQYVEEGGEIDVIEYLEPDEARKAGHGTVVTLRKLGLVKRPPLTTFSRSMARRFLLHQRSADFKVFVNNKPLPKSEDASLIQFAFPRDYTDDEKPAGLTIDTDGWGSEKLANGETVRWRFHFYQNPIGEEELQGVTIFSHGKLAQAPFLFNLTGGLGGQWGQEYLSGQVEADYLDELPADIISPERQRINWEHSASLPLLEWGQERIRSLFRLWQSRRADEKVAALEEKLTPFSDRLTKLPSHEQRIVKRAIAKIASISTLSKDTFLSLGEGLLLAWEGGRLKDLIDEVASTESMTSEELIEILIEANVLTALHTAEAVKAKLNVIAGLYERIKNRELENAVRDYIAEDPWLISPQWETFKKEISVNNLIQAAAAAAKLDKIPDWDKRVDLALGGGDTLLIVEFMKPGLKIDRDHLDRFQMYVDALRVAVEANSALTYRRVVGCLVADKLDKSPVVLKLLKRLEDDRMYAMDWETLLRMSAAKWKEFLDVLVQRAPHDDRLNALSRGLKGRLFEELESDDSAEGPLAFGG